MIALREYVIQICATALLCAVVIRLVNGCGALKTILKLVCTIILAYSLIQPIQQLKLPQFERMISGLREEAERATMYGKEVSLDALEDGIRKGTEAYILEKSRALDLDLVVEVELSDDEIPVPSGVILKGNAAPYARSVLGDTIFRELDIPKERQIWISQ